MNRNHIWLLVISATLSIVALSCATKSAARKNIPLEIVSEQVIDDVWVANRVNFDLHTANGIHFVAYYDKDRYMTVASCKEGDDKWEKTKLPNRLNWDSHNYVSLGVDQKGYIHVSGNMHTDPLVYFRSAKPYDISKMVELNKMVGDSQEMRVTYPDFFNNANGDLFFTYRYGTSGNGNVLLNKFDPSNLSWNRNRNDALLIGIGESNRSAHQILILDSEGRFHCVWMWRWSPLVESCHQICYASTKDFKTWKNGLGESISPPFYPDTKSLIVDNVPEKNGLHNGRFDIITSKENKPYIVYTKNDELGNTQSYISSVVNNKWRSAQLSNWEYKWHFTGGGDKMSRGVTVDIVGFSKDGYLVINSKNDKGETIRSVIDPQSLAIIDGSDIIVRPKYTTNRFNKMSDRKLTVQNAIDDGRSEETGVEYILKWESSAPSHGKRKPEVIPDTPTSKLLLLKLK